MSSESIYRTTRLSVYTLLVLAQWLNAAPIVRFTFETGSTTVSPVINDNLQVAYIGDGPGGPGVYRYEAGIYTNLFLDSDSRVTGYVRSGVSLNNSGEVAFDYIRLSGSGLNIYISGWKAFRGDETGSVQVASYGPVSQGSPVGSLSRQAINDAGDIVYNLPDGVYLLENGSSTALPIGEGGRAAINDLGQIAFIAPDGDLVRRELDGSITILDSTTAPGAYGPALADDGDALAILNTGGLVAIPSLNNMSQYVMLTTRRVTVPFIGSIDIETLGAYSEISDEYVKLIQTGDTFLGSTIADLTFTTGGLNIDGYYTFGYRLNDGRRGVAVAEFPFLPEGDTVSFSVLSTDAGLTFARVPESSTVMLGFLVIGGIAVRVGHSKRSDRGPRLRK